MKMMRQLVPLLLAMTIAACSGTSQVSQTQTSSATTINSATTTPSPIASPTPTVDPSAVRGANISVCNKAQGEAIRSQLTPLIEQYTAESTLPPGRFITAAGAYTPVATVPKDVSPTVKLALTNFELAVEAIDKAAFNATPIQVKVLAATYASLNDACVDFFTPTPVAFKFTCHDAQGATTATTQTYQEAWAAQSASCDADRIGGTDYSEQQTNAITTAYGAGHTMESLKTLYGLCAEIDGYIVKPTAADGSGRLSASQATEASGMLVLCPDHPQATAIQGNIAAVGAAAAAASAQDQAVADGTYAEPGKYLIGTEIQPGTWQSVGTKVTDCYWEVSDSQGEIIDNNFISVAPQFTIQIPADAAGFTASGCSFQRIGD